MFERCDQLENLIIPNLHHGDIAAFNWTKLIPHLKIMQLPSGGLHYFSGASGTTIVFDIPYSARFHQRMYHHLTVCTNASVI